MNHFLRALLPMMSILWLAACGGSDSSSTPQSTTNQSPTTTQQPTKPPPTTQPPNTAPPSTQPPGSQPPGSTPPSSGSGSAGTFVQGTGFNSYVRKIVKAQDGTNDLYIGGDFTTYNGTAANHLIRLRPNGTVAQSFGQGFDEVVLALALVTDSSNALYVGGAFTQFNGQAVPRLIRLTATGLRDSSFQVGSLFGELAFQASWIADLAAAEDGSKDLYVAGNVVEGVPGTPVDATIGRIVRLNPDGSPDPTFPADLRFPGPADLNAPIVSTIAVPSGSGKLYAGGSMAVTGAPSSLLRLNPDGTIDSTFATGTGVQGIAGTTAVETIARAGAGSRDIYAGGRISQYNGTPVNFGTIRVHENGALDTSFVPTESLITLTIAPAEDGSGDVFVFGLGGPGSSGSGSRFLRLSRSGVPVSTFHEPALDNPQIPGSDWVLCVVPALDGTKDLYVGGMFTTYNGAPVNHIARIHADGSLASVVD